MDFKQQLVFQINIINRKLTAKANRLLQPTGLETSSFFLLCHLYEQDILRTGSLEHELCMERTTLGRSFGVLASKGYCVSVKNPMDKRICKHTITPKGKELVKAYQKDFDALQADFLTDKKLLAIAEVFRDVG